ncbi:MAG: hypothetical protein OXC83_05930 [Chloroflexi bacterium]|nr:hypothetical protein [Chloroflexota bacterium]
MGAGVMIRRVRYCLVFALATLFVFACGSEPVPETATSVRSQPTATFEPTTTPIPIPAEEPDEISLTPIVRIDDEGIAIEIETGISAPRSGVGVRSSTSYTPATGKTTVTTTYEVDDSHVDFPWVADSITPASTEMPCNTIGTPGSWRGNPLSIGDEIAVGEIKLRIDTSTANLDTLLLTIENTGNDSVEIQEYAFQLIDTLQTQSGDGPRDYAPSFAETIDLGVDDTKTFTIDLNTLADEPIEPENVVLALSDWESGDSVYLYLSDAGNTPHICNSFEPHAEAQGVGTTWPNRPAPLGRAVKVDGATTVRVTHVERGVAQHLIEAYDGLNVGVSYPKTDDGKLADGYEFLAFQIEVASHYPLMNGYGAREPIEAVNLAGRIAEEYSLELEDIFSTPDAANLVMLEEPYEVDELNAKGYMRLSFVAVTPVEAYDLQVFYALDYNQSRAFLSLEDSPRPRPTPVPVAQNADDGRIGFLEKVDALGEERVNELREVLSSQELFAHENLISNCAQHMVFPSAESRRNVASDAESIGSSEFAENLPEYFTNTEDPDAFCNDLFPPNSVPRMVQALLLDDTSGLKMACTLYPYAGISYLSYALMWQAEVALALWGEDAPVSIDSFGDIYELCDWLESYEPNN